MNTDHFTPKLVILAALAVGQSWCGTARGETYGIELNGTYRVISNGDWAKTNEKYRDEQTVIQTWTITSTCQDPLACAGDVHSDQGWTAPIKFVDDHWIISRTVADWQHCPDGSTAPGSQKYLFWGVKAAGQLDNTNTNLMAGLDETFGLSGACGVNAPTVIKLPMRLERR